MFGQLAVLCGETGDAPWLLFGDWPQIGPRLKAVSPADEEWDALLAASIERNEMLADG